MSSFTRVWYTAIACLMLVACAGIFLGSRDTNYLGDKSIQAPQTVEQGEWWASTLMLRTCDGAQWCSAVVINNKEYELIESGTITNPDGSKSSSSAMIQISWLVTARHCTSTKIGSAIEVLYNPNGSVAREYKHNVLRVWNHPSKDFAIIKIEGHTIACAKVLTGYPPTTRQDYIIGFRGDSHGDKHRYGKNISPAYAYKGQSGGGVFSPGLGLHAIVSTHVDGVNVYAALKDMDSHGLCNE